MWMQGADRVATIMYDFRLSLLVTNAIIIVTTVDGTIDGELSAAEKSLQFEAAFQGKLYK
jgi:hypothetical protein